MREPRRLIDNAGGALGESLRQARDAGAPSERELADAWQRLSERLAQEGVPGAEASAVDGRGTSPGRAGRLLRVSNVIGAMLVAGAVAVLISYEEAPASHAAESAAPAPAAIPARATAPRRTLPPTGAPAASAPLDEDDSPPAAQPKRRSARPSARTAERAGAPEPLADPASELELIARAQRELERDPAAALATLGQHALRFPAGVFVQEREIMRIDAELARGQRARARERARRFTVAYPASPHRRRLHALLEEASAGDHKAKTFALPTR